MSDTSPKAAAMSDSPPSEIKEREVWSSRTAFYFAAVGAAVGFGKRPSLLLIDRKQYQEADQVLFFALNR
jgi:hypothetical protein